MPEQGPYAKGRPRSRRALDGHVSNPERFTDSGFHVVPWTEDLALRTARVDRNLSRAKQVEAVRWAVDQDRLPEAAVDALIKAGWKELEG